MLIARRLCLFSPLERMIAFRYLRPRRKEGFVSVIASATSSWAACLAMPATSW